MFKGKGLFKGVNCPAGIDCRLPNCIFGHPEPSAVETSSSVNHVSYKTKRIFSETEEQQDSFEKRRKLVDSTSKPFIGQLVEPVSKIEASAPSPLSTLTLDVSPPRLSRNNPKDASSSSIKPSKTENSSTSPQSKHESSTSPSVTKPSISSSSKNAAESLNPRLVNTNPASHSNRLKLLELLHDQFKRLNTSIKDKDSSKLKSNQLVTLALDEEEQIAKSQPSVYRSLMSHLVVKYKKMSQAEWITIVKAKFAARSVEPVEFEPTYSLDLTPPLERKLLSRFIMNQENMDKHGYVTKVPAIEDITSALKAVTQCGNWDTCDRCTTRFQVFPERNNVGALTSSGACRYHPSRPMYNKTTKERLFPCCNSNLGTPGCVVHTTHVFKTSDPLRMAATTQFITTPENPKADPELTVAFDCEMGYTTYGMEMIRISATTWPDGKKLFDFYVRPAGNLLDFNSRYSGVQPNTYYASRFWTQDTLPPPEDDTIYTLESVEQARDLLFTIISPNTPLLGHAIDNDLNVLRLIHPTIVDTILLYPHHNGLPMRMGLKRLAQEHLHRDIQNAGLAGHDSIEDAKATGDLVRKRLSLDWRLLKSQGWKVTDGQFVAPEGWVEKGNGKQYLMPEEGWWK